MSFLNKIFSECIACALKHFAFMIVCNFAGTERMLALGDSELAEIELNIYESCAQ